MPQYNGEEQKAGTDKPVKKYKKESYYTPEDILEKESKDIILANFLLSWAGCYIKARGHAVYNRTLKDYVLIYCIEGRGWLELCGKRHEICSGDIFVCPPGIAHSYGSDEKEPWTKYWVHFRGIYGKEYIGRMGISEASPVLHLGENMRLVYMFQEILKVLKMGYTNSNLVLATAYLTTLLGYISHRRINNERIKTDGMNIDKVIRYMLDNLGGNLDLDQLAEYSNVSKYHFTKLFKDKTGYTPVDYYIRLKIQKACELLELSNTKVIDISIVLGYASPYYFSLTFKRIIGQSPQYYRKLHLKQEEVTV
ncbi:MAG TPA: AraC family transcriptional regulator [Clostridiales bacterium]|nr:AraC family transcriptional regulator [Clostridiales bacterium]